MSVRSLRQTQNIAFLLLSTGLLGLSACQTVPEAQNTVDQAAKCSVESVDIACLLKTSEQAFAEIDGDSQWITAASEFSIALHAGQQDQAARSYLAQAVERTKLLKTALARVSAAAEVGKAAADAGQNDIAAAIVAWGEGQAITLEDNAKKYDLLGKLASAQAVAADPVSALIKVEAFPEKDDNYSAFKARSLREIAVAQAKAGGLEGAEQTISKITMGLTYYQSIARSDVASLAFQVGDERRALNLLREATLIAQGQENGYFIAGALRDIGAVYLDARRKDIGEKLFEDAKTGARRAKNNQEKARALSRIATSLADCKQYADARKIFSEAERFADQAKSPAFEHFSKYEIAGSAAFAGDFKTAFRLVESIPETKFGRTTSLKAATKRDIAWGLIKHGRKQEALELIQSIRPARERIMAISRVVRLLAVPDMHALPRYL